MNNTIKERPDLSALFNFTQRESVLDSRFTIKYFGDEARVFESRCLNELFCTCKQDRSATQCCYTVEDIKARLHKYYQDRADYIAKQSIEDFLNDQGIYT